MCMNRMNLKRFGGWEEVIRESGSSTKTEFTKLQNGVTELRFLDEEPFVRWAHWMNNCKRNVSCIGADCPICQSIKIAKWSDRTSFSRRRTFCTLGTLDEQLQKKCILYRTRLSYMPINKSC